MQEYSGCGLIDVEVQTTRVSADNPFASVDPAGLDALLDALASDRRRRVLRYLESAKDGPTSVATLADVLRRRNEAGADRATLRARLHHVELPKLDDAGLLTYDPERGEIEYHGHPLLDAMVHLAAERDSTT